MATEPALQEAVDRLYALFAAIPAVTADERAALNRVVNAALRAGPSGTELLNALEPLVTEHGTGVTSAEHGSELDELHSMRIDVETIEAISEELAERFADMEFDTLGDLAHAILAQKRQIAALPETGEKP